MLCMDEIGILSVYMQDILEHPQHEPGDGEDFCKGAEPQLSGNGDEECQG